MILNLCDSLLKRIKFKVCAYFYQRNVPIQKIITETPFRKMVSAFTYPSMAIKMFWKPPRPWRLFWKPLMTWALFLNYPASNKGWTLRKSTIAEMESRNRKSDAAFGRVFSELVFSQKQPKSSYLFFCSKKSSTLL